ncbi:hypothetical protein GCM10025872_32910 [Barrientosiimonas endolithica]|uniref:GP-PDE domain-containing protein n=1 Tax=Barrientosiimonas endolithica TaxID=1535208 RepID=A0ABM8HF39_9MICO|nr:hypothetical protein GCM10025872_32910 [Barrientosiimonas endolithica]
MRKQTARTRRSQYARARGGLGRSEAKVMHAPWSVHGDAGRRAFEALTVAGVELGTARPGDVSVVAHRGGAGLGPENQLATFATSHALGVRVLETDARATADGVAVAHHDATLDRTTTLRGAVRDRSFADLGGQVLRMDELLRAHDDVELLVDVKEARVVGPLVAAIQATRSADRVWVAGGWDHWLSAVVERCPGVRPALGWRGLSTLMWSARRGVRPRRLAGRAYAAHVPWRLNGVRWLADERVAVRLVEQCADLGLVLRAWTIDRPDLQRRLVRQGCRRSSPTAPTWPARC